VSQIFDALQRSEAERSGMDLSGLTEATEMLQRAERLAASEWETKRGTEQLDATKGAERDTSSGLVEASSIAMTSEARATAELSMLDPFSQFQSLKASLTPQSRLVSLMDNGSPAAEAFRLLGVRLRHFRRDRELKKVLITSTIPQEGKSMIAANLACTLALGTQQRILVLEGDWILPAGSAPSNALELLQSGKSSALMDQLTGWFDWIIIDSPPVLPLADTSVWMRFADGILLVTRQGTTERRQLERGLEAIEPKKLIGALVNSSKDAAASCYYYKPETVSRLNDASTQ
jgi:Mrp family chromosome partitioning ATPase